MLVNVSPNGWSSSFSPESTTQETCFGNDPGNMLRDTQGWFPEMGMLLQVSSTVVIS